MSAPKIVLAMQGVHMGLGHLGLAAIAAKEKIDITKLAPGEMVLFLNTQRNKLKIFAANNVIAYYREPSGHKIPLTALQYIPQAFLGRKLSLEDTLKNAIAVSLTDKSRSTKPIYRHN